MLKFKYFKKKKNYFSKNNEIKIMNSLTKSLLEDLLDIKKTVAIYGGGFKPPTKGHFHVVEKALQDLPEIDELKIFVGSGVRDGIT